MIKKWVLLRCGMLKGFGIVIVLLIFEVMLVGLVVGSFVFVGFGLMGS